MQPQKIIRPEPSTTATLTRTATEDILELTFPTEDAQFSRSGNDLQIQFKDESSVAVKDFFVVEDGKSLPNLQLADGTTVQAADFLKSLDPNMDINTAAGPAASSGSSGAGDYADNAGNLLDGVDKLGSLTGVGQWSIGSTRITEATGEDVIIDNNTTVTTVDSANYTTRIILDVSIDAIRKGGATVTLPGLNIGSLSTEYYHLIQDDSDPDQYLFVLTDPAGKKFFAQLNSNESFANVMSVAGENIQLVCVKNSSFDSENENSISNGGSAVGNEWFYGAIDGKYNLNLNGEKNIAYIEGRVTKGSTIDAGTISISSSRIKSDSKAMDYRYSSGLSASDNAINELTADKATITATASKQDIATAAGIYAIQGQNNVDVTNELVIKGVNDSGRARGIEAANGGYNKVTVSNGDATITAESTKYVAAGMLASTDGVNSLEANNVTVNSYSTGSNAYAMYSVGSDKTLNVITATDTVELNAKNSGTTSNTPATGMHAGTQGTNLIQASENSTGITVCIKVEAGAGADAYAMYAESGTNKIIGSDWVNPGSQDPVDSISITGDIKAVGTGVNLISTGAGNDFVSITGDISTDRSVSGAGTNIINTGSGDDVISLQGKITVGGLNIQAGDDHDTLILHANDAKEFEDFYKDWLDALTNDDKINMSIETVEVYLHGNTETNLDGLSWLLKGNYFGNAEVHIVSDNTQAEIYSLTLKGDIASYVDLVFDGDNSQDAFHLHADGQAVNVDSFVSSHQETLGGFGTLLLDMKGGTTDSIDIESIVKGLGNTEGNIYVTGNNNDSVIMTGWHAGSDTVSYQGETYRAYELDDKTVFVQQDLLTITG